MATAVGERFVRRQTASRANVSNTAAADLGFDTAVISEGGYGSWGSDEVTVDEAGKYLVIHGTGEVQQSGSSRAVGTLVPVVDGSDQGPVGLATHRYVRIVGGADEAVSLGVGILDLASGEAVGSRIPGAWNGTDALADFDAAADSGSGIQLIKLDDGGEFCHLERSADQALTSPTDHNTTRPWIDSTGTWTKLTWPTEVDDSDAMHVASSGDVTLSPNTKYLIVATVVLWSSDSSRHTDICRLNIGGVNRQYASGYQRNSGSQGPPMNLMYLHETGGSAEMLYLDATQETEGADAGTATFTDGALQIIELPASAEWVHLDNSATNAHTADLASTSTYYTAPLSSEFRGDGNADWSLDSGNNAAQNDAGETRPVLAIGALNWDRDTGTSGARKVPASWLYNNGSQVQYGVGGAFSRGRQDADDTWHAAYIAAATFDVGAGGLVTLRTQDKANASNADMGVFAAANRHFLGLQVLDLTTLTAAGPVTGTAALSYGGSVAATGVRRRLSTAGLAYGYQLTTAATRVAAGVVAASYGYDAAATGARFTRGAANLGYGGDVSVTGLRRVRGSATLDYGYQVDAAGVAVELGITVVSYGYEVDAVGSVQSTGTATGTASLDYGHQTDATGTRRSNGAAVASYGYDAAITGTRRAAGSAVTTYGYQATVAAVRVRSATLVATYGYQLDTDGVRGVAGAAALAYGGDVDVFGTRTAPGSGTLTYGYALGAVGEIPAITVVGIAVALTMALRPSVAHTTPQRPSSAITRPLRPSAAGDI